MIAHMIGDCQCSGKRCSRCKDVICLKGFYSDKTHKDGLSSACKVCVLAKQVQEYHANPEKFQTRKRNYYHNSPEKYREQQRQWRRDNPEQDKVIARRSYSTHIERRRIEKRMRYQASDAAFKKREVERIKAYYRTHPEKTREKHLAYYSQKREHILTRIKAYNKAHPEKWLPKSLIRSHVRRTRKTQAGGTYTLQEWQALKVQYNFSCLCCGCKEPEIKLTADHIVPVSKGGSSFIENIQPLCLKCNVSKHTKIIDYRIGRNIS